jgi:hypothetical protein
LSFEKPQAFLIFFGLRHLQVEHMHAALCEKVTMAGAIPEPDRAAARCDYSPSQPEPFDGRIGQTDVDVPLRLDEALKYAVARIEKDPQKIEIIISYLGWDGRTARRLQELGQSVGLNPERVVVAKGGHHGVAILDGHTISCGIQGLC